MPSQDQPHESAVDDASREFEQALRRRDYATIHQVADALALGPLADGARRSPTDVTAERPIPLPDRA